MGIVTKKKLTIMIQIYIQAEVKLASKNFAQLYTLLQRKLSELKGLLLLEHELSV